MANRQAMHSRRADVRRRKERIANATVSLFIVALAGCQNSQRWSQPSAAPSDQYFLQPASSAPSTGAAPAVTGEAKPWKSKLITTAEDGAASWAPRYAASVVKWTGDVGSPDRVSAAADASNAGGRDN